MTTNNLTLAQKQAILNCNTLDSVKKMSFIQNNQYARMIDTIPLLPAIAKLRKNKKVFFPSTLNVAATPIYFLWDVAYFCSLSTIALLSISSLCAIIALIAGISYYVDRYKQQARMKKTLEDYQLARLKLIILDVPYIHDHENKSTIKISNFKKAKFMGSGIVNITLPLFGIGFLGTVSILDVLGLVAMASLAGPVGFGIALFVASAIGLYFGYKQYKYYQYTAEIESGTQRMQEIIIRQQKEWEMNQIKNQVMRELDSKEEPSKMVSMHDKKHQQAKPRVHGSNRYPLFARTHSYPSVTIPVDNVRTSLLRHHQSF